MKRFFKELVMRLYKLNENCVGLPTCELVGGGAI